MWEGVTYAGLHVYQLHVESDKVHCRVNENVTPWPIDQTVCN